MSVPATNLVLATDVVDLKIDEVFEDPRAQGIRELKEWAEKRKKEKEGAENFKVQPLDKNKDPCYNMVVVC